MVVQPFAVGFAYPNFACDRENDMYAAELRFPIDKLADRDVAIGQIYSLLGALQFNGQICGRESLLAKVDGAFRAFVMLPDATALMPAYRNKYAEQVFSELAAHGLTEPVIELIREDPEGAGACACTASNAYILYTNWLSLESPIRCGDCFLPVPLYRLPPVRSDDHFDIISWQRDFPDCDALEVDPKWAVGRVVLRELSQVNSNLSQRGIGICSKITELTGVPTYYRLYRNNGRNNKQELARKCPSCQGEWRLPTSWHDRFDFCCDVCQIVSNVA